MILLLGKNPVKSSVKGKTPQGKGNPNFQHLKGEFRGGNRKFQFCVGGTRRDAHYDEGEQRLFT